ncbi:MAG TPA: TrkA C-terminal domain-containing protein, partial [Anaerolineales bacterium]|nr:TrkA C-terminal domain-containing protein [Anaerolineales bacterium]
AQRVEELLTNPQQKTVYSAGNGEVEVYEVTIPENLKGSRIADLLKDLPQCYPVAVTRAGRSMLPSTDLPLEPGDVLNVSSTFEGIGLLTARLEKKAEA